MAGPRARTEAFLFTDIEGSTRLLRRLRDAYAEAVEEHRRRLRRAFAAHGGEEQGTEGDSFFVVFSNAREAMEAAIEAQLALLEDVDSAGTAIKVRMGIHTGEAVQAFGGYIGLAIHEAARIAAVGHGGQIVVSEATRQLGVDLPEGVELRDLGDHLLKDFDHPRRLYQLCHPDLPATFPPLRSLAMVQNNLPKAITSFVGRDEEIVTTTKLVEANRLVTLTGPGGIGK